MGKNMSFCKESVKKILARNAVLGVNF